jgi:histidinol-phosphatase (PHP family)
MRFDEDHHVHTYHSKDADPQATFEAYLTRAKAMGMKAITFTDHHDIDPAHPLFRVPIDFDAYFKQALAVQKTSDITMRIGVEVGYQSHVKADIKNFIRAHPFEYVILSIHYLDKKDLYTGEYFKGKTAYEAYEHYFQMCLEAIDQIDDFDTFGHLDYIGRYSPFPDYQFAQHETTIDQILNLLIKKQKNLEINTSGFLTQQRAYPAQTIVQRYRQLGGTRLILGSDAHRVNDLGQFFQAVKNDPFLSSITLG